MHKLFLSIPNWVVPLILCVVICRVIWLSHGPKMIGFIIHFLPPQPFKGEDRWRLQNLDAGVADFVAHARERGLITISSCSGLVKDHHESPYQAHIVFNLRSGDSKKLAWLAFFSFGGYWEFVNPDGLSCGQIFWPCLLYTSRGKAGPSGLVLASLSSTKTVRLTLNLTHFRSAASSISATEKLKQH